MGPTAEEHLSYYLLKTALTTLHEMSILPHLTTSTNLVNRRSKYHWKASDLVRTYQSFHLNTNTRIAYLKNNSSFFLLCIFFSFYFFFYSCIINSIITILLSPFSSSSLSLLLLYYNSLFSLPTTLSAPSHPLFPLSSPVTQPVTTIQLLPTCRHPTPPSYTLTTCWLASSTNCTQHPAIPDTNTLHYNNRNTPKHIQGPQNPANPIALNHPPTLCHTPPSIFSAILPIPHNL
jgi:hypothetical protein